MEIEKYFWSLNKKAFTLLSQCDVPKEVFSDIRKEHFIEQWSKIKKYWNKTGEAVDFKTWWDTLHSFTKKKNTKLMLNL